MDGVVEVTAALEEIGEEGVGKVGVEEPIALLAALDSEREVLDAEVPAPGAEELVTEAVPVSLEEVGDDDSGADAIEAVEKLGALGGLLPGEATDPDPNELVTEARVELFGPMVALLIGKELAELTDEELGIEEPIVVPKEMLLGADVEAEAAGVVVFSEALEVPLGDNVGSPELEVTDTDELVEVPALGVLLGGEFADPDDTEIAADMAAGLMGLGLEKVVDPEPGEKFKGRPIELVDTLGTLLVEVAPASSELDPEDPMGLLEMLWIEVLPPAGVGPETPEEVIDKLEAPTRDEEAGSELEELGGSEGLERKVIVADRLGPVGERSAELLGELSAPLLAVEVVVPRLDEVGPGGTVELTDSLKAPLRSELLLVEEIVDPEPCKVEI